MNKKKIVFGSFLAVFSILVFISLSGGYVNILFDYRNLVSQAPSDYFSISTDNPVGVFGVFFGFWAFNLFGSFFVYLTSAFLFLIGIVLVFVPKSKFLFWKLSLLFLSCLFGYFFFQTS